MHFLYPAFLFALLSLAIPVLVHLFNFRRYKKVYFSNVQFLKEVHERQSSRRNLRERLVLASRMLALGFLVLAFARPYLPGSDNINAGKQQVISIFVDNSYSMQTLNREGSLLDEAKQKAKQIASAYAMNDRFQLLTQDFEGRHQRLLNRDAFNDAVDAVKISPQSRNLNQILARQQNQLNMQAGTAKHSYILSDFQKNIAATDTVKAGIPVTLIQLKASTLPNVSVDSAWLLNATHRPGENEKLVVTLHNYGEKIAEKVPLKLLIDQEQKALGSFTVKARATHNDTLSFSGLKAGWQRAEIRLQDNPVTFDNNFYFAFNVADKLPVLLINGGVPDKYLSAVYAPDNFFAVKQVQDGKVDYAGLSAYPIIILSGIRNISAGLAQQLKIYAEKGGTLTIFPSPDADINSYRSFLQPMGLPYPEKIVTEAGRVAAIELQNPVFKNIFESIPQNPDLPVVKKYYALSNSGKAGQSLMRLQTGQPLWQGYNFGKGKVYLCSVALDESFSNLQVHALFVPIMFRIALLSGHDMPLYHTIGNNEPIETTPLQTSERQILRLFKNGQALIPDIKQLDGSTFLYLPDDLREAGIYDLKKQDSIAALLAFNNNRDESDLTYLDAKQLARLFPVKTKIATGDNINMNNIDSAENSGLQLWKLCIILVLIFLVAETLLIRFYKTDKQADIQPG